MAVSKTTHAARRDAARPVLQHKISPLSNISLRRARTAFYSCETAHEASKRGRRRADLGVLRHVFLATAAVVTAKHDRATTRRAVVVYCIKRTAKKNAKKLQEGAPFGF